MTSSVERPDEGSRIVPGKSTAQSNSFNRDVRVGTLPKLLFKEVIYEVIKYVAICAFLGKS